VILRTVNWGLPDSLAAPFFVGLANPFLVIDLVIATETPPTKSVSLSVKMVLAGALAGLFVGIFFGDDAKVLQPIGDIYAKLLEVAVYPYLVCSLLHGLGRLTPSAAWRLFRSGWIFYVAVWALTFGVLIVLATGIPAAKPFAFTPDTGSSGPNLIDRLLPSNPFSALSQNYVPAVILFCLFFGVALQTVKEKEALLSVLESIRATSLAFWKGVVRFAPIAVFALFAAEAGTLRVHQAESVSVFLLLFFIGAFGLAFWVLPGCLAGLTPLKSREVLGEIRAAFVIALVTTLSVAAVPFITAATQKLADRCGIDDEGRNEIIRTSSSVAYPFGQLGNYFVYLFLVFAAGLNQVPLHAGVHWLLPPVTLISCIGSPTSSVDAVKFLSSWIGLPDDTTALYVGLMALIRYGQVIVSVAGFAFLNFTVVLAYYQKINLRFSRLLTVVGATAVITFAVAWGGRAISGYLENTKSNPYLNFALDSAVAAKVKVSYGAVKPDASPELESCMARIQQVGELRVGYNDGIIPFCYRNSANQLVGYDVSFAYRLAADLNVHLRFIPFEWQTLTDDLKAQRFDIAMAGIYVTDERLATLRVSNPYFKSPLAVFLPRERANAFRTRSGIISRTGVRMGVFNDPVLVPRVKRTFPNAQLVLVPYYNELPDFSRIDAAVWTLAQAEAIAAAHPGLAAVQPSDTGDPYLFAYLLPPDSEQLENFVNYWLQLKRTDGSEQQERDYWINRFPRETAAPRWSILHNVLGEK
jgi:Na+/H+-dicarboxylate symporter/ABC-type amino acid transport substrate-binding protein